MYFLNIISCSLHKIYDSESGREARRFKLMFISAAEIVRVTRLGSGAAGRIRNGW